MNIGGHTLLKRAFTAAGSLLILAQSALGTEKIVPSTLQSDIAGVTAEDFGECFKKNDAFAADEKNQETFMGFTHHTAANGKQISCGREYFFRVREGSKTIGLVGMISALSNRARQEFGPLISKGCTIGYTTAGYNAFEGYKNGFIYAAYDLASDKIESPSVKHPYFYRPLKNNDFAMRSTFSFDDSKYGSMHIAHEGFPNLNPKAFDLVYGLVKEVSNLRASKAGVVSIQTKDSDAIAADVYSLDNAKKVPQVGVPPTGYEPPSEAALKEYMGIVRKVFTDNNCSGPVL